MTGVAFHHMSDQYQVYTSYRRTPAGGISQTRMVGKELLSIHRQHLITFAVYRVVVSNVIETMAGRPRTRYARLNGLICGAKTRRGTPCQCKALLRGGKCKFHGGMSTGAKTPQGKARQLAGFYRWLAQKNAQKAIAPPAADPVLGSLTAIPPLSS